MKSIAKDLRQQVWFVTGSQDLYGEHTQRLVVPGRTSRVEVR
jgi:L-arabinose isomerase